MPWNRRELIQLSLLLLCVPMQYLFTTQFNNYDSSHRDQKLLRLIASLRSFSSHYFRWEPWRVWWLEVSDKFQQILKSNIDLGDENQNESPAVEVINFRYRNGPRHFAGSMVIRSERPDNVIYKVGQVVVHKTLGYRGVIIGWDQTAKAPESWLKMMHPDSNEHWREMPNYAILVDIQDRPTPQMTYVPQESLRLVTDTQIEHPRLESYFSKFNGQKYLPLPWLRTLYPKDE